MYLSLLTVLPIRPLSIRSHSEIVSAPFLPYLRLSEEKKSLAPFLITYPFRAERIPLLPYLCRWRSRPPPRRPREARPRPRGAARPLLRACVRAASKKLRRWNIRRKSKLWAEISPLHCLNLRPSVFRLAVRGFARFANLRGGGCPS